MKDSIRIPLAGNAFLESENESGIITEDGIREFSDKAVFGVYIRFAESAEFNVSLSCRTQEKCTLMVSSGRTKYTVEAEPGDCVVPVGNFISVGEGYMRFEISGVSRSGKYYADIDELILDGITKEQISSCIYPEDRDNYYWTRRGPSVHCSYDISELGNVEWFYNEVTLPHGFDPVGTYAMAIGFEGGYFGIQTNSEDTRRILFSIWSPFSTDNPEEIPDDMKVKLLYKNPRTHAGEFGGEGSGGQSYVEYNWKTGVTQKFIMHVKPDGNGRTEYTAYFFFDDTGKFEPIASFSRPKTDTYLKGPHSFLENFDDCAGYVTRMAYYGNAWAYLGNGKWEAPTKIRFTGDATARHDWRMDYMGGLTDDGRFYLKNGGFFNEHETIGKIFEKDISMSVKPDFDPETLTIF